MDNFYFTPSVSPTTTTTSTTTTTTSFPSTTTTPLPSSQSQYYLPPHETVPQFPYAYPLELMQPGQGQAFAYPSYPFVIGMNSQPHLVSKEQERKLVDAWNTKVARNKRKMARQKTLSLSKNPAPWASSTQYNVETDHVQNSNNNNNANIEDPYTFCTPDNKRLRILLKKELKNSDVGSLGRIVLPKREAEENLPVLFDKDGIQIMIRDVYSNQTWGFKYKYWSNNKSRMYVLENTVDFVKQNGLAIGDSITLFEDECKNLYVSVEKVDRPIYEPSYKQQDTSHSYNTNSNNFHGPFMHETKDEEEASLALLIEQLRHQEELEANSLATLSMGGASSHIQHI